MKSFGLFVGLLVAAGVAAAPGKDYEHKVKESVAPPRGWTKVKPAPADHFIDLRIGLPQPKFHELEQHLYEISDPFHERYGAHLSKEEVEALIAPHEESVSAVDEWLASYGFASHELSRSSAGDWVKLRIPVSLAEEMLKTEYHVWQHEESGDAVVRTTSYSLPEHLHVHIDVVQPTTTFARMRGMKATYHYADEEARVVNIAQPTIPIPSAYNGQVNSSCNGSLTPTCLRELYNIGDYTPQAADVNKIACTGYLEQYANFEDFNDFNAKYLPEAINSTFDVIYINNGSNDQSLDAAGVEADLDTQYAFGLSYPTPATFYTTGGSPPFIPDDITTSDSNEPYADWLSYILNDPNPPQTISTSYGDDEQTVPYSYATRVCRELAQLGARGVSIIFSSGDNGVGDGDSDPATQECYTNNGLNETKFVPAFPASCPYVTAVGATWYIPEETYFISGGGFSNYFSRPLYQDIAVPHYVKNLGNTYEGLYNASGRAYPDVAAQGQFFWIFSGGENFLIGGTSAAAPTVGGIVSLLNDARLAKGLPALGFLNPLIYAIGAIVPDAFNDIVGGSNRGCGTEGFTAEVGWDPVTGFGTPNFGKLHDIAVGNIGGLFDF
ncbi:tripeptidyl peptidase A [Rhodofomes roseus]|uniref:tripeptidyl-peptidase II n=1 Tax=Rhodofomes roseus TaxID=34475 RepID=A0ABQ8K537_9APHY|nr:tripeptidyl peptidase A [Rhodofomes roseus]KAH9831612.1 tripeptidyl peptidase A [Rhodofomes roseus]